MEIDKITIGEAKELVAIFGNQQQEDAPSKLLEGYIGKYVIVRTRNEGINCGVIKALDNTGIILAEARRLYYHKPKDIKVSWYEGVSQSGLSSDSKISTPVEEKVIVECYSVTLCTKEAIQSLKAHTSHEQN